MIARISTSPCKPMQTRQRRRTHLSASRRISHKISHRRLRQPLATKNVNATNGVQHEQPATKAPLAPQLPRTLSRPQRCEINREYLNTTYPDLVGVPTEYIRTTALAATGPDMFAALAHVEAQPSTSSLTRELEIIIPDEVALSCPTHMLAIYSSSSSALKRRVTIFPTHDLVLAAHCANLPHLPPTAPDMTGATVKLPVVPMCLPSPETFNVLQSYLYTKRFDVLFSSLLPTPPSFDDPTTSMPEMISRLSIHLSATCDKLQLARHAMIINGLWRNACALGVQDDKLWGAVEVAWEAVIAAMAGQ